MDWDEYRKLSLPEQLRAPKVGHPTLGHEAADEIERLTAQLETVHAQLAEQTAIVDRIWDQFGRPDCGDLKGRSIHDLIQEVIDSNAEKSLRLGAK
jgi:hypothetical protein